MIDGLFMQKPKLLLYSILGPIRPDIRPLVYAVETAEQLLFVWHVPMEDIKAISHIYSQVAERLKKRTATVTKAIERLTPLCWDALVLNNLLLTYIGDPSTQVPPPRMLVIYLATYAYFELPFAVAAKKYPDILFPLDASACVADVDVMEAIRRSQAIPVISDMPICPECGGGLRQAQAYCHHCGQHLDWSQYKGTQVICDKLPSISYRSSLTP